MQKSKTRQNMMNMQTIKIIQKFQNKDSDEDEEN